MSPKCTSIFGHKFEARFSYQNPAMIKFFERATQIDRLTGDFVEDCRDVTYERDICVRCGHVVEKKP